MLHESDDPGQKRTHGQPEHDAQGKRVTLRAKMPMSTPAIRPLIMEPITMPTIPARTAGVNQAVRPSRMPKTPPRTKPSTILLLMSAHSLERRCLSTDLFTAFAGTFNLI